MRKERKTELHWTKGALCRVHGYSVVQRGGSFWTGLGWQREASQVRIQDDKGAGVVCIRVMGGSEQEGVG